MSVYWICTFALKKHYITGLYIRNRVMLCPRTYIRTKSIITQFSRKSKALYTTIIIVTIIPAYTLSNILLIMRCTRRICNLVCKALIMRCF